jgi:hypothetical protein
MSRRVSVGNEDLQVFEKPVVTRNLDCDSGQTGETSASAAISQPQ